MNRVLLSAAIHTDYGQFSISWRGDLFSFDGETEKWFSGQKNGLLGASEPSGLVFILAHRLSSSQVDIHLLDREPQGSIDNRWEDVVEVSTTVRSGVTPVWVTCYHESFGELNLPSGNYRVRFSSTGRDTPDPEEEPSEGSPPIDSYLIEFWPSSTYQCDRILRMGSRNAEMWHSERRSKSD